MVAVGPAAEHQQSCALGQHWQDPLASRERWPAFSVLHNPYLCHFTDLCFEGKAVMLQIIVNADVSRLKPLGIMESCFILTAKKVH